MIITEPYLDDFIEDLWEITISTALIVDGEVYGVTGCDVSLASLNYEINNVRILEKGFLLLISFEGMVIAKPESWNYLAGDTSVFRRRRKSAVQYSRATAPQMECLDHRTQ